TNLEESRQTIKFRSQTQIAVKFLLDNFERNEEFSGDPIAPAFDLVVWDKGSLRVRNRRLTEPDMREFMRECEHLSGLCVSTIYEYQRCKIVRKRKPTKFIWIEWQVIIIENHPTAHDHNSSFIRLADEQSQSVRPAWNTPTFLDIKTQSVTHDCRRL